MADCPKWSPTKRSGISENMPCYIIKTGVSKESLVSFSHLIFSFIIHIQYTMYKDPTEQKQMSLQGKILSTMLLKNVWKLSVGDLPSAVNVSVKGSP